MTRSNRRCALTLIEIMVVVSIIGLLAAVLIPQIGGQYTYSRQQLTITAMAELQTDLDLYKMEHGRYPASLAELTTEKSTMKAGPYRGEIGPDGWAEPFQYASRDDGKDYELRSTGDDRARGGEEFDSDIVASSGKKPSVEGS